MIKILVANRSEVACRIARTVSSLGLQPVGIYEEADVSHLSAFEEAHLCKSYTDPKDIIQIAKSSGAKAIHPGYGFLSESYKFSSLVEKSGLAFIGPSPSAMKVLGDKQSARKLAESVGLNTPLATEITSTKSKIPTYPCLLKITGAGGGRGIYRLDSKDNQIIKQVLGERDRSYPGSKVIAEQLITPARHIEVQLYGDKYGNVDHLGERECSTQRRRQKLIEESPALNIDPGKLQQALDGAVELGRAAKLDNLSTVEFLYDGKEFFFIEVNPRLQVEHTVTEEIHLVDLVETQIRAAFGEELDESLRTEPPYYHSVQVRIVAEHAEDDFHPSYGTVKTVSLPNDKGLRVEAPELKNFIVSPKYDSLIAKFIWLGNTRENCIAGLTKALRDFKIEGVATNKDYLSLLLNYPKQICTHDIDEKNLDLSPPRSQLEASIAKELFSAFGEHSFRSLKDKDGLYVLNSSPSKFQVGDKTYSAKATAWSNSGKFKAEIDGRSITGEFVNDGVTINGRYTKPSASLKKIVLSRTDSEIDDVQETLSPITGTVVKISCKPKQKVEKGDILFVIESMKMEYQVPAGKSGTVKELFFKTNDTAAKGSPLCEIE